MKVSLKTSFSKPRLVNEALLPQLLAKPFPFDCTRTTAIKITAEIIWIIRSSFCTDVLYTQNALDCIFKTLSKVIVDNVFKTLSKAHTIESAFKTPSIIIDNVLKTLFVDLKKKVTIDRYLLKKN